MGLKYHLCYTTVLKQVVDGKRQATLINYRESKIVIEFFFVFQLVPKLKPRVGLKNSAQTFILQANL